MNGFSQEIQKLSNETLLRKHKRLESEAKYSNESQDIHWEYRAVLEELRDRRIDPSKTITTATGMIIPCDSQGRPHRDQPEKFIRFRY